MSLPGPRQRDSWVSISAEITNGCRRVWQINKVTEEKCTPKIRDEIVYSYTQDRKDVTGKKKSADT